MKGVVDFVAIVGPTVAGNLLREDDGANGWVSTCISDIICVGLHENYTVHKLKSYNHGLFCIVKVRSSTQPTILEQFPKSDDFHWESNR